ncbi:sigma-70 family RNA polymerase sigma factor [Ottowia thiooxydans]|uniref:RNA polymerase sigma factor (Sigma-70 family) n=1 Tax=Ottowia thiooxydans TaxID=219182 RepID=A0ABV2Q204_9BURK
MAAHVLDEPGSLENLYSAHHGWLQAWLRRRLGNSFDAADLAHDTFVRVLCKDAPLVIQEPRAFLTTVAQGVVFNHIRRRKIEQAYMDALALVPEEVAPSPESRAIMLETLVEIDRLLDGLPSLVRRAFLLSQLDGLRQSDIALQLGVSIPTVKRYIARALEQCCFQD